MVVLSEALVSTKARVERLEDVKNLNLCGQGITDVSILQQVPHVEVLSLSVNHISSLRHFAFCGQLQQLYLRANDVSNLAELRYLMALKDLKVLWLAENPCTKLPHYRAFVVAHLPSLENLDNEAISEGDRQAAKGMHTLQAATVADVLAEEEQEAAQQQELQLVAQQEEALASDTTARHSAARQQLPHLSPVTPSAAAQTTPTAAALAAATAVTPAAAAAPAATQHTPQLLSSPQHQQYVTEGLGSDGSNRGLVAAPGCMFAAGSLPARSWDTGLPAYCNMPDGMITPGNTPTPYAPMGHSSGSSPEPACAHSMQQALRHSGEYPASSGYCKGGLAPLPYRPQQLQSPSWSIAAQHQPHNPSRSSTPSAGSRTNVLYAVMALLAELDVGGLNIVQREVQLRLKEQQQ